MATVKRTSVPPTHPTVWLGLGLAVIGLLMAVYSYTGARVYNVAFAIVALAGALLALVGILVAAWGRSIMSARASRARRMNFQQDALSLSRPTTASSASEEALTSEDVPTVAPSKEKKRFSFGKRAEKRESEAPPAQGVFAFKRRAPEPQPEPKPKPEPEQPVRVTLRCPQCASTFAAEGVRPFTAVCATCGFRADV